MVQSTQESAPYDRYTPVEEEEKPLDVLRNTSTSAYY